MVPDRLHRKRDAAYPSLARQLLEVYQGGLGATREELHELVAMRCRDAPSGVAPRRVGAFAKLLDERSIYERDRKNIIARERLIAFSLAARKAPPFTEGDERCVKAWIARRLGWTEPDCWQRLHRDAPGRQCLLHFEGYSSPGALLARYNVAQTQAALYGARRLTLTVDDNLKSVLRLVRLAQLLHDIRRIGAGRYRIVCSGPASILRRGHHYGVRMASILPSLLACRGWSLRADVEGPAGRAHVLCLNPTDGLSGGRPSPPAFDSNVEATFARRFGTERDGWRLHREGDVLHEGQHTFVPDFSFRHHDGREALLEIVGFWTPEYLRNKADTLRRFDRPNLIVAVRERKAEAMPPTSVPLIRYRTRLRPEAVLDALNGLV